MEACGYIERDGGDWLNAGPWDRRDDFRPDAWSDQGDVRETEKGIQVRLHPEALLLSEPLVWPTVQRWNAGQQELEAADFERLSAFELSAKVAMVAASVRSLQAKGGGDG